MARLISADTSKPIPANDIGGDCCAVL